MWRLRSSTLAVTVQQRSGTRSVYRAALLRTAAAVHYHTLSPRTTSGCATHIPLQLVRCTTIRHFSTQQDEGFSVASIRAVLSRYWNGSKQMYANAKRMQALKQR